MEKQSRAGLRSIAFRLIFRKLIGHSYSFFASRPLEDLRELGLANLKHSSVLPMAFTEQGVSMLSSVLRSDKAIKINIEIMRAFARYRALLIENSELRKEIEQLDRKLGEAFKYLLGKIDALHQKQKERKPVGYKIKK